MTHRQDGFEKSGLIGGRPRCLINVGREGEKLRRALYGQRSERKERLLWQLKFELDELTASATEDELAAETGRAGPLPVGATLVRYPSSWP